MSLDTSDLDALRVAFAGDPRAHGIALAHALNRVGLEAALTATAEGYQTHDAYARESLAALAAALAPPALTEGEVVEFAHAASSAATGAIIAGTPWEAKPMLDVAVALVRAQGERVGSMSRPERGWKQPPHWAMTTSAVLTARGRVRAACHYAEGAVEDLTEALALNLQGTEADFARLVAMASVAMNTLALVVTGEEPDGGPAAW